MQEEFEMYIPIIASQLAAAGVAVPPEAAAVAEGITAQLGAELPDLVPEPSSDPHVATLELMEAIREVGTCYTSAAALAAAHLPALLRAAVAGHPDGAVRRLAERALAGWRRIALQHLRVLVGADVCFWDCGRHAVGEECDRHAVTVGLPSTADVLDQHTPPSHLPCCKSRQRCLAHRRPWCTLLLDLPTCCQQCCLPSPSGLVI
jgi:hypothetical protein